MSAGARYEYRPKPNLTPPPPRHYNNAIVTRGFIALDDYAIVQTGGKQYRVSAGDTIRVESIAGDIGDTVELTDVRMVSADGRVALGTPRVEGARVVAEISESGKGKKIVVFKYKSKVRYRRKKGHRQRYTDLTVTDIIA